MSEYTVVAVEDTEDICTGCLFAGKNTRVVAFADETLIDCNNAVLKDTPKLKSVFATHYPICTGDVMEDFKPITYRLAHKLSGVLLTDQDMVDLVNHYKEKPS